MNAEELYIGRKCNWKGQPDRLVYRGKKGSWHQFALVKSPEKIWCEVLDVDLHMIEAAQEVERVAIKAEQLEAYDAGILNDFGGGNVGWWQDYIRAELERAHDHYQQQVDALFDGKVLVPVEALNAIMELAGVALVYQPFGTKDRQHFDALMAIIEDKP